ncbi:hypothetical protein P5673_017179 [Acropora cervicornis]|uniref:Uncharacterized protein n=1 Tax=Acropora cervicornis TaxID=6130 RepID=A0AAD9QFH4_ACRCE|nr:hypothetical protein P5673_017179 [Acropora cervicornis]
MANGIEYQIGAVISEDNALYTLPKLATIRKILALPDEIVQKLNHLPSACAMDLPSLEK